MLPAYSASARAIKIPARFREDEVLLYSEDYSKHQHWLPSGVYTVLSVSVASCRPTRKIN
jgi:hypothetical protein